MKNLCSIKVVIAMILTVTIIASCKKNDTTTNTKVPTKMTIDIPSSINQPGNAKKSADNIVPISGNDIYKNLRLFIGVGAGGAAIIDGMLTAVQLYNLTSLTSPVSFKSKDDGYTKTLTVSKSQSFNGITYDWEIMIQDQDGSKALELFFNANPVKGVAIYQSSKLNHSDWFSILHPNAIVQIEYSEAETNYQKQEIVTITGLTVIGENGMDNLKMFVGQNSDVLDIYGNSNHPTAILFDNTHQGGRDYAFRAHANSLVDIGVAEVSLPETYVTVHDSTLFTTYSIYNVLYNEIEKVFNNNAPADSVNKYIQNAKAPGYFVKGTGFVSCGSNVPTTPAGFTSSFINLKSLLPYVPNDIKNLKLSFAKK